MTDHINLLRRAHLSNLDMLAMLKDREAKPEVIDMAERIVATSRQRLDAAYAERARAAVARIDELERKRLGLAPR